MRRKIVDVPTARTLTCPFIQSAATVAMAIPKVTESDLVAIRNDNHSPANIDCIAKGCMAWRTTTDGHGFCMLLGGEE